MKTLLLIILVITNLSLYGQVKKPLQHKHDGFYGRATLGFGSTSISESVDLTTGKMTIDMSGLSGDVNIHLGYSVIENLQLYGALGGNVLPNPKYEVNGKEATTTTSSNVYLLRYGAGASYYFMPYNISVSFDLSAAKNQIETNNVTANSDWGVIFNFGAGKEWWVSKDWGIGAMLYFYTGTVNDVTIGTQTPKIDNTGFGISFSATYN